LALSDKFGDTRFIESALMEKGREITLMQRVEQKKMSLWHLPLWLHELNSPPSKGNLYTDGLHNS